MGRDFTQIRTVEDVRDIVIGSTVKEMQSLNVLVFETIAGERFVLTITAVPVPFSVGGMSGTVQPQTKFDFKAIDSKKGD